MAGVEGVEKFKPNTFLTNLQQTYQPLRENGKMCDFCASEGRTTSSTSRCLDCRQALCENCASVHCRTKLTQNHMVLTLHQMQSGQYDKEIRKRRPVMCEIHPGKKVKLFCQQDGKLLCLTCKANAHDGHRTTELSEIGPQEREYLRTLVEPVKKKIALYERSVGKLDTSESGKMLYREHLVQDIESRRDFLCKVIDDCCTDLKRDVDTFYLTNSTGFDSKKDQMKQELISLKTGSEFVEKLVTYGRDAEIVAFKKNSQDRLAFLKSLEASESHLEEGYKFNIGNMSKEEAALAFGKLMKGHFARQQTPLPSIPADDRYSPNYYHGDEIMEVQHRSGSPHHLNNDRKPKVGKKKKRDINRQSDNRSYDSDPSYRYHEDPHDIEIHRNNLHQSLPETDRSSHPRTQVVKKVALPPEEVESQPPLASPSEYRGENLTKAQLIRSLPVKSSQDSKKTWPTSIAVNQNGELLIVDSNNKKLKIFGKETFLKAEIGTTGKNKLVDPWAVAVLKNGNIVVSDRGTRDIKIYSSKGKYLYSFRGNLLDPHGVATNSKDEIIVADWERRKVYVFDKEGHVLNTLAGVDGEPLFQSPYYVCCTPSDDIVVSDYMGHCVKIFDSNGKALFQYGSRGQGDKQLKYPNGVCADNYGNLIVVDRGNNRIHLLSQDGHFRSFLVTAKDGVVDPTAVVVDRDGHLAVTEGTGMVKFYRYFPL